MSEPLAITDPAAALALANGTRRRILFALMQKESSLQALHADLGLSLSLLHYHVRKLCRLGLARIDRLEARAGRAIAIYRSSATSYLIPADLGEPSPSALLRAQLDASLERDRARFPTTILLDLAADRTPRMRRMRPEGETPFAAEGWARLNLDQTQAGKLALDVRELVSRYREGSTNAGRECLFYFALARQ